MKAEKITIAINSVLSGFFSIRFPIPLNTLFKSVILPIDLIRVAKNNGSHLPGISLDIFFTRSRHIYK